MGWLDLLRTALDAHLSVDAPALPQMLPVSLLLSKKIF